MWVQPLRTADLRVIPAPRVESEPKVAVLVNANARQVNERVIRSLSHVVPQEDLYVSRSELDARRIAQWVVDRKYQTVFCAGGDGTFVNFVNEIHRQLSQRREHHAQRAPRFGVLRLGTGNSLASLLNASPLRGDRVLDDVLKARAGEVPGYRRLDMLEVEGKITPFAGLGADAKVLNDYVWVKQNLARGVFKSLLTGGGGYFTSVAFRSVPHFLAGASHMECEVINSGDRLAYALGSDGMPRGEPIAPGGVLYRGPALMAAASTVPFYGYEIKMFPFAARRRGMMHLRVAAVSASSVLANLPKLWSGKWFDEKIFDFHAHKVTVRMAQPVAFQIGGDALGYRQSVEFGVAREQLELVDFTGAVN